MLKNWTVVLSAIVLIAVASLIPVSLVAAEENVSLSPEGYWQTVPDDEGSPSVIQVWIENGKAFGKVIKIYPKPGRVPDPVCEKCEGDLKDKPIVGMTILKDLTQKNEKWSGGSILDPNNGKTYKCYIEVTENGEKLKVRGFIGMTLLGRSQHWVKVSKPD